MSHPVHRDLVQCLTEDTPPRVWSLLVTIFGDLAQAPGAQISGRALSVLCDAIGIKPAALRVALHRLRKDGWIESHRAGRHGFHTLTAMGRAQSAAATPHIYGQPSPGEDAWLTVALRSGAGGDSSSDTVWVAPNVGVSATRCDRADTLSTRLEPSNSLPDWMSDKICSPDMVRHAALFADRLDACIGLLSGRAAVSPLDIAVLRILVVHGWRRIVLKVPGLPAHVFPEGWAGERCRARVRQILDDHPRIDLSDLEALSAAA